MPKTEQPRSIPTGSIFTEVDVEHLYDTRSLANMYSIRFMPVWKADYEFWGRMLGKIYSGYYENHVSSLVVYYFKTFWI